MKPILICISFLLFISPETGFSQTDQTDIKKGNLFIYGEAGVGKSAYSVPKVALNCIWKNNIVSIAYQYASRDAPNVPSDYIKPLIVILSDGQPRQHVSTYSFMYGKVLFTKHPGLRYVLRGGFSAGNVQTPDNYKNVPNGWFPYSTYTYNYQPAVGFIIDPSIELPFGAGFGVSFDVFANINSGSSYAGIGGNLIFGKVRNRVRRNRINKHLPQ